MSRSRLGRHGATCHLTSRGFGDAFTLVGQRIAGSRLAKGRSSRAPMTTRFGPLCGHGRRGRTGSNRFLLIRLLRLTPSFVGSAVRNMRSSMTALLPCWAQCPAALRIRLVSGSDDIVFGCCNLRKNICRDGLSEETQGPMETILAMLRGWVDNMGAQAAKSVSAVLWLRGLPSDDSDSDQPLVDVVVLSVDVFYKPKLQHLALCALVGSPDNEFELPVLPALPCVVTIATRANRVAKKFREVNLATSDELAYRLASMRRQWVMRPMEYSVVDTDSLLQMRLLSAGDALEGKRPVRTRKQSPLDEAIFLGDPTVVGAAMASSSSGPADFPPDDAAADADLDPEGVHDDVPADVIGDILDCDAAVPESAFADMMVVEPHNFEDDPNLFDEPEAEAKAEEQVAEAEVEEALDDAVGAAASLQELAIAHSVMGALGYINTDVLPWSALVNVGRITDWPKDKPEQDRSVSCRCYMHPGCGTPAKRRHAVTDRIFSSWLFFRPALSWPDKGREARRCSNPQGHVGHNF